MGRLSVACIMWDYLGSIGSVDRSVAVKWDEVDGVVGGK